MNAQYLQYLKSEDWKKIRERKLQSAGCICERCKKRGWKKQLNVHHKTYDLILGQEKDEQLIILCKDCHKVIHQYLKDGCFRCPKCFSIMQEDFYYDLKGKIFPKTKGSRFVYSCKQCSSILYPQTRFEDMTFKLHLDFFQAL